MKQLKIAFSTCPNDTFIFYALVNGKLSNCPYKFDVHFGDIEELNNLAFENKFDIIKLSFNAFAFLQDRYYLLDTGSALGRNCGPLLVSKNFSSLDELQGRKIGFPGQFTTANYLFDFFNQNSISKIFLRFDQIIPQILSGKIDAGVIIHESRFTYKDYNLISIADLGQWWEDSTSFPIPLGGIAVKKGISFEILKNIDYFLKKSIIYANSHYDEAVDFSKIYAKELDNKVIKSHIELYVNDMSYSLGKEGLDAIKFFIESGKTKNIFSMNNFKIVGENGFIE